MKTSSKKTAVQPPVVMARPPLADEDRDFSGVPNIEIMPCLLYAILRESVDAQKLKSDLVAAMASPSSTSQKQMDELFAQLDVIRININFSVDVREFVYRALASEDAVAGHLNEPWQKLTPASKEYLTIPFKVVNPPAFIATDERHTHELFKTMRLAELLDMKAFQSDDQSPSTTYAFAPLDFVDCYPGRFIVGVVVDLAHYDHNAIKAALVGPVAEEILNGLPGGITPQVRKASGLGRMAEWRGVLNSLALARVSGRYTAKVLKTQMPEVYNQIAESLDDKGHTAVQKKLDSATRRFVKRFHEILPFENHPPLCLRHSRSAK